MTPRLALAACACFVSCSTVPPPRESAEPTSKRARAAFSRKARPANTSADDAARYLAGLPGRADSPFKALESADEWIEHSRAFDSAWNRWREKQRPRLDEFQRTELSALESAPPAVFYPFGGPDVLNAITLFPGREEYLLVGLEPPGSIDSNTAAQLESVRDTLASVLNFSFFITDEMDRQMRGQVTDGVLPVMLVQLVREGYSILGATPVTLGEDGAVTARGSDAKRNLGVVIDFSRDDGRVQHLAFFQANLHNARLERNKPFQQYLAHRRRGATFLKSTSYLTHKRWFSRIRSEILDHSAAIVQDDSGIPYRFFDPEHWTVRLYGAYEEPIAMFKRHLQDDLATAYQTPDAARPLGFRIGYSRKQTNLQVAVRQGQS